VKTSLTAIFFETTGATSMNRTDSTVRLAISSFIALGAMAVGQTAFADAPAMEQCAGVVKAGANDCATSTNACHSHVTTDRNPEAWVYLPKGTCERIAGAHLVKVADPTPKK
jgi:uncharacterized membrane protein